MTPVEISLVVMSILILTGLILVWRKLGAETTNDQSKHLQEQLHIFRGETSRSSVDLREELAGSIARGNQTLTNTLGNMGQGQLQQLSALRSANQTQSDSLRTAMKDQLTELRTGNEKKLEDIQKHIKELTGSNREQIENLQQSVTEQLKELQTSNEKKLDQMRQTVDEKLQSTLEKRLGESFKLVSEQLGKVERGLGEMKSLADGVGDLKRVLTNVKVRGTWGEVQLEAILEQLLTPDQYESNVKVKEGSDVIVDYAIKMPGPAANPASKVYLPIDSKFPQEDYLRLQDASEKADTDAVLESTKALVRSIKNSAKDISDKYIDPPNTTDFAIMFLATEGLFSEVLRQPGLMEDLQTKHRVIVAGPTTLSAIINSLRVGFRTLAIEKRSAEVWQVLAAVKEEFRQFGEVMNRVKRQLGAVSNTIDETQRRTRAMDRKLTTVESLPVEESTSSLGLDSDADPLTEAPDEN